MKILVFKFFPIHLKKIEIILLSYICCYKQSFPHTWRSEFSLRQRFLNHEVTHSDESEKKAETLIWQRLLLISSWYVRPVSNSTAGNGERMTVTYLDYFFHHFSEWECSGCHTQYLMLTSLQGQRVSTLSFVFKVWIQMDRGRYTTKNQDPLWEVYSDNATTFIGRVKYLHQARPALQRLEPCTFSQAWFLHL